MLEMIEPIKNTIKSLILKGFVLKATEKPIQQNQVETYPDDVKRAVENYQNYGLKGYPPKNSDCLLVNVGAATENPVIFGVQNRKTLRSLPTLKEGEAIVYNNSGVLIHLKSNEVKIKAPKFKVENETNELISVLIELIDQIKSITTVTTSASIGIPNPPATTFIAATTSVAPPGVLASIDPSVMIALDLIKAKLESFKP